MILYHTTDQSGATGILSEGFRDNEHQSGLTGVWLSNVPITKRQGAKGSVLLEVDLTISTDRLFYEFDIHDEESRGFREFLIPATLLNSNGVIRQVDYEATLNAIEDGELTPWDEYPEGEPEKTFAEDTEMNDAFDNRSFVVEIDYPQSLQLPKGRLCIWAVHFEGELDDVEPMLFGPATLVETACFPSLEKATEFVNYTTTEFERISKDDGEVYTLRTIVDDKPHAIISGVIGRKRDSAS